MKKVIKMRIYRFLAVRYNNFGVSEYIQRKRNKEEFPDIKMHCNWLRNKYGVWTSCHIYMEE